MRKVDAQERYASYPPKEYRRDLEGRLKLDVSRLYLQGKCYVHVYAIRKHHRDRNARWLVGLVELPTPMRKAELKEAMHNIAAITAMEIGEDYVLRSITRL